MTPLAIGVTLQLIDFTTMIRKIRSGAQIRQTGARRGKKKSNKINGVVICP
jgi:hypothetical protein